MLVTLYITQKQRYFLLLVSIVDISQVLLCDKEKVGGNDIKFIMELPLMFGCGKGPSQPQTIQGTPILSLLLSSGTPPRRKQTIATCHPNGTRRKPNWPLNSSNVNFNPLETTSTMSEIKPRRWPWEEAKTNSTKRS